MSFDVDNKINKCLLTKLTHCRRKMITTNAFTEKSPSKQQQKERGTNSLKLLFKFILLNVNLCKTCLCKYKILLYCQLKVSNFKEEKMKTIFKFTY